MLPVSSLILQHLLRRQDLNLPGVGTLRIEPVSASLDGGSVLKAPYTTISLVAEDPSAESILGLLGKYYDTDDLYRVTGIYNEWFALAITEDGILEIENLGRIFTGGSSIELLPEFESMLNPSTGKNIVVIHDPKIYHGALRQPKKGLASLWVALIIIMALSAMMYIAYYLATRTTVFEDIISSGQ